MDPSRRNDPARRPTAEAHRLRVAIVDCDQVRKGRVGEFVKGAGALVQEDGSTGVAAALVAIPPGTAEAEAALVRIKTCKAAGIEVVAYATGADEWPVSLKCRPLIAGASRFVGAGSAVFESALCQAIAALVAGLVARVNENEHLRSRLRALGVEGAGPAMMQVFRQVLKYAALSDLPVLVTGETGTGKERITRALHQCDPKRSAGPFVAVNCGALVSTLAESELFGHRRGAFTGAERSRPGLVRAADRGVLFLDEIGELDLGLQTKLLRVLQEGRVLGVGEENEVPVDVRVVAATHRDLHALVEAGKFRADLLHRLCVLPLHLKPLRERTEDMPLLVEHFLRRNKPGFRMSDAVSPEYMEALTLLKFPGNIRQLENILRQSLVNKKDAGALTLADFPGEILAELGAVLPGYPEAEDVQEREAEPAPLLPGPAVLRDMIVGLAEKMGWSLEQCMDLCEREMVSAALDRAAGNQTKAANLLGVTARCVYNKIRKHGLREGV